MTDEVIDKPAATQADTKAADTKADVKVDTKVDKADVKADAKADVKATWPDDWRSIAAGDDEKLLNLAKRYNTPADLLKAQRAVQQRISSGELRSPLPKDATEEQVKAWRAENGIPEAADKYDLGLKEGVVLGDDTKPLVDAFVKDMHGLHASPEVVKGAVGWYLKAREQQAQAIAEKDASVKTATEDELRGDWGGDYRTNVAGISSMLNQADSTVAEAINAARLPDGSSLANNAGVLRWLANHARQLGFVGATVVPSGGDVAKTIGDELESIKNTMYLENGDRNPAYWKDEKKQTRYRELLDAKERVK